MENIAYFDLVAGILIGVSLVSLIFKPLRDKYKIQDASKRKYGHINLVISLIMLVYGVLPTFLYDRPVNVYLIYFSVHLFIVWRISQSE